MKTAVKGGALLRGVLYARPAAQPEAETVSAFAWAPRETAGHWVRPPGGARLLGHSQEVLFKNSEGKLRNNRSKGEDMQQTEGWPRGG